MEKELAPAAGQPLAEAFTPLLFPAQISEDDQFLFCGTTSGDVLKFNLKTRLLSDYGPKRVSAKHSRVGPPPPLPLFCLLSDLSPPPLLCFMCHIRPCAGLGMIIWPNLAALRASAL